MEYDTISERIKDGTYQPVYVDVPKALPDGFITDENRTVAWNREQVNASRIARDNVRRANDEARSNANNLFMKDLTEYVSEELGAVNAEQAELVVERAYREGHSGGYYEVLNEASELVDFLMDYHRLSFK